MPECNYCGESFPSTGNLFKHYHNGCPSVAGRDGAPESGWRVSIPLSICPPEMAALGESRVVGLKVMGRIKGNAFLVEDVSMWR